MKRLPLILLHTAVLPLLLLGRAECQTATSGTITFRHIPLESSLSGGSVVLPAYSPAVAADTHHVWIGTPTGNVLVNGTGPAGATGAAGTNGTNGTNGTSGVNGSTWYEGSGVPSSGTGVNGDYYLNTAAGGIYLKSAGAWNVIENITGPTGATGATGPTGATGAAGTNGSAGTAATVAVGTTTTGAAGTSASVTNSGTASAATFNFTIPQGAAGAAGSTGATGAAGAAGTGYTLGTASQTAHMNTGGTAFVTDSGLLDNGTQLGLGQSAASGVMLGVTASGPAVKGLLITMASSQSANPLEIDTSTGTPIFTVLNNGALNTSNDITISGGGFNANYFQDQAKSVGYWDSSSWTFNNRVAANAAIKIRGATSQTGDLFQTKDGPGNINSKITNGGGLTNYGYHTINTLATPIAPTLTTSGTAGATTYYYRITAVSGTGETLASTETSIATGNATLTSTNKVNLTWTAVTGAESYNVYGRTTGAETKLANVAALTYSDTGATPSGALPTANTTGYVNSPAYQVSGTAGYTGTIPTTAQSFHFTGGILVGYTDSGGTLHGN